MVKSQPRFLGDSVAFPLREDDFTGVSRHNRILLKIMRVSHLLKFTGAFTKALARDPIYVMRVVKRQFRTWNWVGILPLIERQILEKDKFHSWVKQNDLRPRLSGATSATLVSLIMPVYNAPETALRSALRSVVDQSYPHWELCVVDDASTMPHVRIELEAAARSDPRIRVEFRSQNGHIVTASNQALAMCRGEWVGFVDHDDELEPQALTLMAQAIEAHPVASVIYSDEDKISPSGVRYEPHFKPDWNLDLFLGQNYISHFTLIRRSAVSAAGNFRPGFEGSQDYDLLLRVIEGLKPEQVVHVPLILYHWRSVAGSTASKGSQKSYATHAAQRALEDYCRRNQIQAQVTEVAGGYHRLVYEIPKPLPSVSVVICSRDQLDLLRGCLAGVLERTDYAELEVILIDNGSQNPQTLRYFESLKSDSRVRVQRCDEAFNFSRLNNIGVGLARGEFVLFLNNDIEIIEGNWLKEMVSQAVQPGVGAVGAKLLYANGRIQHAGVVLGIGGVAGHAFKHFPGNAWGYFGRAQLVQNYSAVTAACLLMPKSLFHEVGGFDERNLAIAYNDVDLCLKIRERGLRVVWTPFAQLRHLESISRGVDGLDEAKRHRLENEAGFMKAKWSKWLQHDPAYNPNLSLKNEEFLIVSESSLERQDERVLD